MCVFLKLLHFLKHPIWLSIFIFFISSPSVVVGVLVQQVSPPVPAKEFSTPTVQQRENWRDVVCFYVRYCF